MDRHLRADPDEVAAALAAAAQAGPYFTLYTGPAAAGPEPLAAVPWRPLGDWYGPAADGGALAGLIDSFATRLGTTERRVAASILFQGHAARLWSPVLGCLAARGVVPDLDPGRLSWRYLPGQPIQLRLDRDGGWLPGTGNSAGTAALVYDVVVTGHLEPLALAVRRQVRVAAGLLWGNAASALVGSVPVLADAAGAAGWTGATKVRGVVADLLAHGRLRGTGSGTVPAAPAPIAFTRRSCCLYYRVPGGGLCGDCPLGG